MAPGLARLNVEFPAVPRAAQYFPAPCQAVFARPLRLEAAEHVTIAERRALMRAPIDQRVMFAIHIEHANLATGRIDDLLAAGRDLAHGSDDVTRHLALGSQIVEGQRVLAVQHALFLLRYRHFE